MRRKDAEAQIQQADAARKLAVLDAARNKALARHMHTVAEETIALARMLVTITEIRSAPGVYFLLRKGDVVYVGQAENVLFRMGGHKPKDFDDVRMLTVTNPVERDRLEQSFIHLLTPPLNIQRVKFNKVQEALAHPQFGDQEFPQKTASPLGGGPQTGQVDAERIRLQAAPVLKSGRDS